jgi:hypothetical protein
MSNGYYIQESRFKVSDMFFMDKMYCKFAVISIIILFK